MSAERVVVNINGCEAEADASRPLLEAIREAGISIPTLCYHPALQPYGACRLCLVEAEWDGRKRMVAACSTPPAAGMRVWTGTEDALRARKLSMQLILARCSGVPGIWEFAAGLGVVDTPFEKKDEDCIQCGLCERVCRELVGRAVISYVGRGAAREVRSPFGKESDVCIGCEACVAVCPTGKVRSSWAGGRLVMETWDTTLEIESCAGCGCPYVPKRMLEHLGPKAGKMNSDLSLCPACRRRAAAEKYRYATRALSVGARPLGEREE
jgi:predicted molibdopterin-dependent oxidoreductase YjgC